VRSLAFSHDGKNALSGSDDLTAAVWNVRVTGELVKRLSGEHGSSIVHVYYQQPGPLPDTYGEAKGTRLLRWTPVTVGSDWRVLWDELDGVRVLRDRTPSAAQTHWPQPHSRDFHLKGLTSDTLEVYKGTERRAALAGNGGAILKLDLSAAADRALTLGSDGQLRLWDVSSRSVLSGMPWKPDREIAAIALSPDGTTLLLGGSDGTLKLWTLP
jgi:WD40 repeat protein